MSQKKNKTKIGHSLQQLQDGLILTLQDKPVLLNGQVNQDDDVFENYQKTLNNKAQHNKQLKQKLKAISNAASSHLQAAQQGALGILPHYDDYTFKSDQVDLEDGTVTKRSRPKLPKNISNDFEAPQNINSQYYQRGSKFKQRKKQKPNTKELLSFLNQTALQKQVTNEPENASSAVDVIEQSLNQVRKRKRVENQHLQDSMNIANKQDEQLLARAIKMSRQKNVQPTNLLNIIKEQAEDENQNVKYTQIQMNPVNYKQANPVKMEKTYNIVDAAKGTTSCLNVHLPSQKIMIKTEQSQMPISFKDISKEQLQRMKQQISFLQEKQMSIGLAGTLQFLRQQNLLNYEEQFGRTNDQESHHNKVGDRIKLQYRNASGKLMKPKQAFRYMSAIFHGQGPGKNKIQKIKKKQLLEMRMKQAASQPGKLMNLLQKHQQKSGEAHMVIQLGSKNKQQ